MRRAVRLAVRGDRHGAGMHHTTPLPAPVLASTGGPRPPIGRRIPARESTFGRRLDAEWTHLRTSRRALRTARAWAGPGDQPFDRAVRSVVDLDEIVRATRTGGPAGEGEDAVLIRLIDLARHHELAGRILVQRLLPGLIAGSLHYRSLDGGTDTSEIVVAAAWLAIRRYDTATRTRHVAATLISDAVFQAFRRPLRRRSASEVPCSPDHFLRDAADVDGSHPFLELAEVIRSARRAGVDDHHLELIRHLVRTGSPGVTAAERRVTPRTIRNHRDRAVESIRAALAA